MTPSQPSGGDAALLARLKAFCFPGGEEAAHLVRSVKTTQRGEIRMSPEARWTPFTAEEQVDVTRSRFCWEARVGGRALTSVRVIDAYEDGRGRLLVSKGPVRLVSKVGPEVDRGELQRYLAYTIGLPYIVLNHASPEWTATGPRTLRVRDRLGPAAASVEIDLAEDGRPVAARADRPRLVGKRIVLTPWSASGDDERVLDGVRVPFRLEASWLLAEGPFLYIRIELTSFEALR